MTYRFSASFPLVAFFLFTLCSFAHAQSFGYSTSHDEMESIYVGQEDHAKAIDIVFAAEAYLDTTEDMAKFNNDTWNVVAYLITKTTEPYRSHCRRFNFYRLHTSSLGHENIDTDAATDNINTCFGGYWTSDQQFKPNAQGWQRLESERTRLASFWDYTLLLFNVTPNSTRGLAYMGMPEAEPRRRTALVATRAMTSDTLGNISAHELSHLMGYLEDEYFSGIATYAGTEDDLVHFPNVTRESLVANSKWSGYAGIAGIQKDFNSEGGKRTYSKGIFRPTFASCLMSNGFSEPQLCPPCEAAIAKDIAERTGSTNPPPADVKVTVNRQAEAGQPTTLLLHAKDTAYDSSNDVEDVPDAIRYFIDFGDGTFETTPFSRNHETGTFTTHRWGTQGSYVVRVRAMDGAANLSPEVVESVTVATPIERLTFVPLGPPPPQFSSPVTPTFLWGFPPGEIPIFGTRYTLEILGFGERIIDGASLYYSADDASLNFTRGSTYQWRVKASLGAGSNLRESAWSNWFYFKIGSLEKAASGFPILQQPVGGATDISPWIQSGTLRFQWTNPTGFTATQTRLRLTRLDPAATQDFTWTGAPTSYSLPLSSLLPGARYNWSIVCWNGTEWRESDPSTFAYGPQAPVLSTPAAGATGLTGNILFQWSHPGTTPLAGFRWQIRTGGSLWMEEFLSSATRSHSLASANLVGLTSYSWRVGAVSANQLFTTWSDERVFTTGAMPPNQAPLIWTPRSCASYSTAPLLEWSPTPDALFYELQLRKNTELLPSLSVTGLTVPRYVPALSAFSQYIFRVRACNATGAGPWSSERFFRIDNPALAPRAVWRPAISPRNTISFSYPYPPGTELTPSRFQIQVAHRGDFSAPRTQEFTLFLQSDVGAGETSTAWNTIFTDYWPGELLAIRVRGWNVAGSVWTDWSNVVWSFPTYTKQGWPALPLNGAVLPTDRLPQPFTFAYGYSESAQPQYDFQITRASDPTFATPLLNAQFKYVYINRFQIERDLRVTLDGSSTGITLGCGETYLWRVKAGSLWSAPSSFQITLSTPTVQTPDAQTFPLSQTTSSFSLAWGSVTSATGYDIELDDDPNFGSVDVRRTSTTPTVSITPTAGSLLLNRTGPLYWRVRAKSGTTLGGWSATRSITLALSRPTAPRWEVDYALWPMRSLSLPFQQVSLVHHYEVQLFRDSETGTLLYQQPNLAATADSGRSYVPIPALEQNARFVIRIRGINAAGAGAWGSTPLDTMAAVRVTAPVSGTHLLSGQLIDLKWTTDSTMYSTLTGYQLVVNRAGVETRTPAAKPASSFSYPVVYPFNPGKGFTGLLTWKVVATVGAQTFETPLQQLQVDATLPPWAAWSDVSGSTSTTLPGWRMFTPAIAPGQTINLTDLFHLPANTIQSPFFSYAGSYAAATQLRGGVGYWVKTLPGTVAQNAGTPPTSAVSIPVVAGWNLIGNPFASDVTWTSSSLVIAGPFGYRDTLQTGSASYELLTSIRKFEGFWVKASTAGTILLNPPTGAGVTAPRTIPDGSEVPVSPEGGLQVSGSDFLPIGYQGGTFSPVSKTYTLSNTSAAPISYEVKKMGTQTWLAVNGSTTLPARGTLAPGASVTVTLSIPLAPASFAVGTYSETISFINRTSHSGDVKRNAIMTVRSSSGGIGTKTSTSQ